MCFHRERMLQFPVAQNHDQLIAVPDEAGLGQCLGRDLGPLRKDRQPRQIDRRESDTPGVAKPHTPCKGELAHQRQLSTLEVWPHTTAGTSILAFHTASGRLALPGSDAAPHALMLLDCPFRGLQLV